MTGQMTQLTNYSPNIYIYIYEKQPHMETAFPRPRHRQQPAFGHHMTQGQGVATGN